MSEDAKTNVTIDDIYKEYNINSLHTLFAGNVIAKMAENLVKAHKSGLPLPSQEENMNIGNIDPRYIRYEKMLKVGIPVQIISMQMKASGLNPSKLLKEDYNDNISYKPFLEHINSNDFKLKRSQSLPSKPIRNDTLLNVLKERLKNIRKDIQDED